MFLETAKFVIRYVFRLPLVLWCGLFSGMTDNDSTEGDEWLWQFQHFGNSSGTVLVRIESRPDGTKADGVGSKQNVLCSSRTVLNPESASLSWQRFVHVSAYDDGQRSLLQHTTTRVVACEFGKFLFAVDDYKVSGLAVDGSRCSHTGTEHRLDVCL